MKAWRFYDFEDMRLDDVPAPEVKDGWVLIHVEVCQPSITEIMRARGVPTAGHDRIKRVLAEKAPVQLFGHEFTGRVEALGAGVRGFRIGDRVVANTFAPCGRCLLCLRGKWLRCHEGIRLDGIDTPGCFAEYTVLPANALMVVPEGISPGEAATIQPLSAAYAAVRAVDLLGRNVVIFGQGVMGLNSLQLARTAGASWIAVVDVRQDVLGLSRDFGADVILNATDGDPVEAILAITNGEGADVVFEAAGGSPREGLAGFTTVAQAFRVVAMEGTVVQVANPVGDMSGFNLDAIKRKAVRYQFPPRAVLDDFAVSVSLVQGGRVRLKPMITHTVVGLEKLPEAFEITARKRQFGAINPAQVVVS